MSPIERAPALRAGVAVIPMDGAVQLRRGDEDVHVLRTDAPDVARALLERLDGTRSRADVVAGLGPHADALLTELLAALGPAGLLATGRSILDALRSARVAVVGHEPSAARLADLVTEHGARASVRARGESLDGADACVCVAEAPDLALFHSVNDSACRASLPCLFVDLSHGGHATVGPFFVPGDGACHACFRARLHENTAAFAEQRAAEQQMLDTGAPLPGEPCLPAHRALVAGVAVNELVAFFAQHRPLRTLNRAITIALEHARMWTEPVWRVPWCPSCGAGARR